MAKAFPFTAIVGQDEMKTALLVAAVDPSIGGVLVFGDRGTGKSTAIRALAALMPKIPMGDGCAFNCNPEEKRSFQCPRCAGGETPKTRMKPIPVVDLPLGATEDRVIGALDLERALHDGEKAFEPGLLARAHRGFLYIDEVNLLEDHIVDSLLDVAASGENVVEREGLSVRHPARFVLVGSGNPEEGELRPQLLDRFGLSVEVRTPQDIESRIEIVRQRDAFERDPDAFIKKQQRKEGRVRKKLQRARELIAEVDVPAEVLEAAARLCLALGTDGLRGELTLVRTARARAALDGRREAGLDDLRALAPSVLRHRLRRDPLDESGSTVRIDKALAELEAA
ncbi:MAG: magnesium chelatase ATPase subunit I [Halieaceae bacterium]|jgi:magnesium chelatase subunit I|nr:magnesium chelatase ATPase subunit I [Halieaceae bacterium]